ncbi:hypothetical protein [Polyangium sp. 6x1]|uniref:hypothetical protein n=1 Tax=Polyangium sp. 6x1 TaxID=3042689 RepID=UPI002482F434|nr:hypothetical protein [Polyangium sp. 6x1]MDI1442527.1 hypothetical protein [Polyangium sp. 6x1]
MPIASAPGGTKDFALGTNHLYLLNNVGDVYRTPVEGGCAELVLEGYGAKRILVGRTFITRRLRTSSAGRSRTPSEDFTSVAFTNANVYWSHQDTGTIKRAPIGGSAGQTLFVDAGLQTLVADESFIYFTKGTQVLRHPVLGGQSETFAAPIGAILTGLRIEPDTVFWFKSQKMGMGWRGKDGSFSGSGTKLSVHVADACSNDTYVYVSTMLVAAPQEHLRRHGKKTDVPERFLAEYFGKVAANNTGVYVLTGGVGKLKP